MTRRRKLGVLAAALGAAAAGLALSGWLVLQSQWLNRRLHDAAVSAVSRAIGGRVEIGAIRLDWGHLRAEFDDCTLHGTEPAGSPPLLQAARLTVALTIGSVWRRDIALRSIEVSRPRIFLLVLPDGRTNLPRPPHATGDPGASILRLAIGHFAVSEGTLRVDAAGRPGAVTPFSARGERLNANFRYAPGGPRYEGSLGIHPLDLDGVPVDLDLVAALERGRITLSSGRVTTGASSAALSAGVLDLAATGGSLRYDARVALADAARILHQPSLQGAATASGSFEWKGGENWTAAADVRVSGAAWRTRGFALRNGTLEGGLTAGPGSIEIRNARVSSAYHAGHTPEIAEGRIGAIAWRAGLLELSGIDLQTLGGTFRGRASLRDLERYTASGDIAGFAGRRLVALYSAAPLPWDALLSGSVGIDGTLRQANGFRAQANIVLAPAPDSAAVHGRIAAAYDGRTATLDLGRSTLALPSSRAVFAGSPGSMLVSLDTRDLDDFLPVLGERAADLPVQLRGGEARFDGIVSGPLDLPQFSGRTAVTRFRAAGHAIDSFAATIAAAPDHLSLQAASVVCGSLRATFDAAIALQQWRPVNTSAIFGSAKTAGAPVAELLALAGRPDIDAAGTLGAAASFSGTWQNPLAYADVTVTDGSYQDEPFDRATAHVTYNSNTLAADNGAVAGDRQVTFAASFRHTPGRFDTGQLHWQARSNAIPLERIRTVHRLRPALEGTLEVRATGDVNLTPAPRVTALDGEFTVRAVRLDGRPVGDARVVASSQSGTLRARLEATLAGSSLGGEATVALNGDYAAETNLAFTRLGLAQLRGLLAPPGPPATDITGSADGTLHLTGPALHPESLTGELQLSRIEIAPADSSGAAINLALHNNGPIVATIAGAQLTVARARLAGRITDIGITGKIDFRADNALNLRWNGQLDAAAVHELDPDFTASGSVNADATLRGPLRQPQVTGRVQFEKVSCNVAGFANGLSDAAGVIQFTGNRATIQTFTGQTGGGTVRLSGFAGYEGSRLIFQLQAQAHEVRIRYPEGVSTVADADLRLTGAPERSTLGGTITIRRSGFNTQSDFSSLIARSAEPLQTPSTHTGVLAGMNFDVQINTAPDVQVLSSLTDDVQIEANLRLRGTLSNPALVGRVTITQGQVIFYGTKYTVRQGSISFFNALKVEPVFDIDLETKARGVDITLSVSGPLHHLNLTPRSDPPMQFSEIVALLATGITPTGDPALLSQQTAIPQQWQQVGASALLGQAIANPVAGRLQRFFGVSRLRIDPTLPGIEINNPQARVTLEQQVTPDITFTYIVNVTNSNPQVVRLEWALNKQWSVVALREENGVFGLDFFFKKRF